MGPSFSQHFDKHDLVLGDAWQDRRLFAVILLLGSLTGVHTHRVEPILLILFDELGSLAFDLWFLLGHCHSSSCR